MTSWTALPRTQGRASRQAHVDLPEGTYEREIGREGFSGPATQLYHGHPPTSWTEIDGPLRPRAFDTSGLSHKGDSPWSATPIFTNAHVAYRWWSTDGSMDHLVRNADGDELLFLHQGAAELFCDYGHLTLRDGDFVVLPRGTLWRLECHEPVSTLLIEATESSYRLPERGSLGAHAVFDPGVLDTPVLDDSFRAQQDERTWRVQVKARGRLTTLVYPFNPLDVVGWKGNHVPLRLNWRDVRPVVSARYHLPPSAHSTFVSDRFVVCTFCPRPLESDPRALRLPFFHSNDDYDEVIFYHRGQFMSRDDLAPGAITFHPRGLPHGPHPKALAAAANRERTQTEEVAVMLDTRDALDVSHEAEAFELFDYADSWRSP